METRGDARRPSGSIPPGRREAKRSQVTDVTTTEDEPSAQRLLSEFTFHESECNPTDMSCLKCNENREVE